MKAEVSIPVNRTSVWANIRSAVLNAGVLVAIAQLFSQVLEEKVSTLRAWHLVNVQLSFIAVLLFGGSSILLAALLIAWFATAVYQCLHTA